MKDVQNQPDERGIAINRVGVKNIHLPFSILEQNRGHQTVQANVCMAADLHKEYKGTHLSRFVDILGQWSQRQICGKDLRAILANGQERLGAARTEISLQFKYFIEKQAPVSMQTSWMDYDVSFHGVLEREVFTFIMGVVVPIQTLCPCSKTISKHGAHNQRAHLTVKTQLRADGFMWIEELVRQMEGLGSCELYPLLKREDEKFVTEQAYENPKFVEDVLRDAVLALRQDQRVAWFQVECESHESIHNHNAFAYHAEWVDAQVPESETLTAHREFALP
ncbi:MAG TPA: GTP cyclohydrolase FolE2 [Candidatus Xenobia bacterium]